MQLSAGIVLVRVVAETREVLVVHPGGPFFAKKDLGCWSIPKGLVEPGESVELAARREFAEETGWTTPLGALVEVGFVTMRSGKRVQAFAAQGDFDCARLASNHVELEYPPRSGRHVRFPEVDRAQWATLAQARSLLTPALVPLAERALAVEFTAR